MNRKQLGKLIHQHIQLYCILSQDLNNIDDIKCFKVLSNLIDNIEILFSEYEKMVPNTLYGTHWATILCDIDDYEYIKERARNG